MGMKVRKPKSTMIVMDGKMGFLWRDKPITSEAGILNELGQIKTKAEAKSFLKAYKLATRFAKTNMALMIGFLKPKQRTKAYKLFGLKHPVEALRK